MSYATDIAAVTSGDLNYFKQLKVDNTAIKLSHLPGEISYASLVAENGHLELLKFFVLGSGQAFDLTVNNTSAVKCAASHGHLEVIK